MKIMANNSANAQLQLLQREQCE